jgi:hypothetical protein
VNFEQYLKLGVAAATTGPGLGRFSQILQSPHPECDDGVHNRRLGRFQAAAHDPIRAAGTWSSTWIGTNALIGLLELHGRDSRKAALKAGLLRLRLISILTGQPNMSTAEIANA